MVDINKIEEISLRVSREKNLDINYVRADLMAYAKDYNPMLNTTDFPKCKLAKVFLITFDTNEFCTRGYCCTYYNGKLYNNAEFDSVLPENRDELKPLDIKLTDYEKCDVEIIS